ncbi:MAG: hypothetical protein JO353_13490, partial [Phycisphaerae bacterium]|nr:hypothetical protein [Phycisphaerae bacterium]
MYESPDDPAHEMIDWNLLFGSKLNRARGLPLKWQAGWALLRVVFFKSLLLSAILLSAATAVAADEDSVPPRKMPLYETRYYNVFTDLDPERAREACIRMTKMAEEYHARTAGFAGNIAEKLPFYLFKSADEYYAAGGLPKSAGVFNGERLMAMADPRIGKEIWHVVQHEGFHQFVHAVIGGEIPIWVNEGMAEYFGESIFTGDGF